MSKIKQDRTSEENINTQGLRMWIKECRMSDDIDIEFEDGYISYNRKYSQFKKGQVSNKNFKKPRSKGVGIKDKTGEINHNRYGSMMKIIKYNNANDIIVEFDNKYVTHTCYNRFKNGEVQSVYDKTFYGIGYIGEGVYKTSINNCHTKEYSIWKDILRRCYDEEHRDKSPTYKDVIICDEWHNFQNFAKWYDNNYYQIDNYRMQVEKDIINKGNRIYSPENCVIVPEFINNLFIQQKSTRGEYPIGVSMCNNRLRARLKKLINGKQKEFHLGYFDTPEQAFEKYKFEKEKHIKEVAENYKDQIPERLYIAMINYKVEITD